MRPAFFLLMVAILAAPLPAAAQGRRAPGVQPLDRILPEISRTHPGRFYDADGPIPGADGALHYHLKWMTPDGRIVWLDADARTGRVLGTSPGRDSFDGPGPERYYAPAPSYPVPGYFGGGYGWRGGYPGRGGEGYGGGRNRGGGREFGGGRRGR